MVSPNAELKVCSDLINATTEVCEADDTPQCYIVGEVHAEKLYEALCCVKGWKKNVSESFYCMSNSFTTVVTVGPSFSS